MHNDFAHNAWLNKTETELLFALLRKAIGTADHVDMPSGGFSWDKVLLTLEKHSLIGLTADAIMSLPVDQRPSQGIQMKLLQHSAALTKSHHKLNAAICTIFSALQAEGLHPILLKGQGLAALYPQQYTRSCGDIDLYLHSEEFFKGARIIFQLCGDDREIPEEQPDLQHHIETNYGEVHVEIHYRPDTPAIHHIRDAYRQWMAEELHHTDTVLINGMPIAVPRLQTNVVYVFEHMLRHLMWGGIGIRQYIDVLMLLRQEGIDTVQLHRDLDRFHLLEPWQMLGGIMVYQLGLPRCLYPMWNTRRAGYSQGYSLRFVLFSGNFGQLLNYYKGYVEMERRSIRRIIMSLRYNWHYQRYMFHLVPYGRRQRMWNELRRLYWVIRRMF